MALGDDGKPHASRDEVIARLRDAGCGDAAPYTALLRPSIWMRVDAGRSPGPMESRFGGPAMMPEGFDWPTYTAEPYMGRDPNDDPKTFVLWYAKQQQLPMFLVAQLNLAELPIESALPREGMLSFFTDPFDGVWGHSKADQQGLRVIYTPPEQFAALRPYEMPARSDHHGAFADSTWPTYRIEYFVKWGFSDWEAVHRLAEAEPFTDQGERVRDAMREIFGYSFGHFLLDGGLNHQGDPRESAVLAVDSPQRPPTYEEVGREPTQEEEDAFHAELERRTAEWTCLLSITQDDYLKPVVSDTGGLSFLIRKADLAARRFDRPWIVRS